MLLSVTKENNTKRRSKLRDWIVGVVNAFKIG